MLLHRIFIVSMVVIIVFPACVSAPGESAAHYYFLGEESRHDPDLAISYYRRALEIEPHYTMAYFRLGEIHWHELGDRETALAFYTDAVSFDPKFGPAYISAAYILLDLDRFEDALMRVEEAIDANPDFAEAYKIRAHLRMEMNQPDAAFDDISRAVELADGLTRAEALMERGLFRRRLDDPEGALDDFYEALEIDPRLSHVYLEMGRLLMDMNRWDEAEDALRRGMAHARDEMIIQAEMAELALRTGHPEAALDLINELVHREPEHPQFLRIRGRIYSGLGRYPEAQEDLSRVLVEWPDNPWVYMDRGVARYHMGMLDAALDDLNRGLEEVPEVPYILAIRAALYIDQERYHLAFEDLRIAVNMEGDHPFIRFQLAYLLLRQGELDPALAQLDHPVMGEEWSIDIVRKHLETHSKILEDIRMFLEKYPVLREYIPGDMR